MLSGLHPSPSSVLAFHFFSLLHLPLPRFPMQLYWTADTFIHLCTASWLLWGYGAVVCNCGRV